ncbi:MAG: hypothetical protein HC869_14725 [Rhodospirillales bacterium]|nr:hypothetical protein [Rhodospirillales bacterium]
MDDNQLEWLPFASERRGDISDGDALLDNFLVEEINAALVHVNQNDTVTAAVKDRAAVLDGYPAPAVNLATFGQPHSTTCKPFH